MTKKEKPKLDETFEMRLPVSPDAGRILPPTADRPDIRTAENLSEYLKALESLRYPIKGSVQTYSLDQIRQIAGLITSGILPIDALPKDQGIREQFARVLRK